MKKLLYLLLLGGAFLFGRKSGESHEETELIKAETPEKDYSNVNFYDSHHLRISDESMLNRRILPLPSAINMRDIGGYSNKDGQRIKWNKIFRGEELRHLNEEDREKFNDYHIKYIIDFREENKAKLKPDIEVPGAQNINIPVLKGLTGRKLDFNSPTAVSDFMNYIYHAQVSTKAHRFAEVLKILRDDPDATLYIHCTNGKDRTGFMIALLMLIAGVDEEKIISEYSLTNLTFDQAFETLSGTMANEVAVDDNTKLRGFFGVDPDWLQIQLDYIKNNYDSVDDYLIQNTDLTQEDINTIRKNILE